MKLTFFFLILFTISSCANQAHRRDTNLTETESESEIKTTEKESPKSPGEDRATKGEIELGLKGESTKTIIIDSDEEAQPVEAEGNEVDEAVKSKQEKKGSEKVSEKKEEDCIPGLKAPEEGQKPPEGWDKRCKPNVEPEDDSVLIINAE